MIKRALSYSLKQKVDPAGVKAIVKTVCNGHSNADRTARVARGFLERNR